MGKNGADNGDVILAAGGIVTRETARGREFALIHRPGHQDWTLPKGKLDPKERWQDAALREVEEETGFDVELGPFAGSCSYMARSAPKVVLYWHMRLVGEARFAPDDRTEVDQVAWLPQAEALERLSYAREKRVLAEAVSGGPAEMEAVPLRRAGGTRVPQPPPAQGGKLLRWLLRNVSRHS